MEPLMTESEVVNYFNVSVSFLRQSRMDRRLCSSGPPYIKIGKAVRYKKTDVEKWLEERTITPKNKGAK